VKVHSVGEAATPVKATPMGKNPRSSPQYHESKCDLGTVGVFVFLLFLWLYFVCFVRDQIRNRLMKLSGVCVQLRLCQLKEESRATY
jgi:hypothetical protein